MDQSGFRKTTKNDSLCNLKTSILFPRLRKDFLQDLKKTSYRALFLVAQLS